MRRYFRILFSSPLLMIIIAVIIGLSAATVYFYNKSKYAGPEGSLAEINKLERRLERVMLLPDETPTLATVADPEQLKSQPFFVDAKKGDKVLIYGQARKAILYDPRAKKIVNVGPVAIGENNPSSLNQSAQ